MGNECLRKGDREESKAITARKNGNKKCIEKGIRN